MIQMLNYLLNKDFKGVIISMNPWRKGEYAFWHRTRSYKTESNGKFRTVDLISEIIISLSGLHKGMERTKERLKTDWDKLSNLKNREQSRLEKKRTKMQAPVGQYEEVWPVKMESQKVRTKTETKNTLKNNSQTQIWQKAKIYKIKFSGE